MIVAPGSRVLRQLDAGPWLHFQIDDDNNKDNIDKNHDNNCARGQGPKPTNRPVPWLHPQINNDNNDTNINYKSDNNNDDINNHNKYTNDNTDDIKNINNNDDKNDINNNNNNDHNDNHNDDNNNCARVQGPWTLAPFSN